MIMSSDCDIKNAAMHVTRSLGVSVRLGVEDIINLWPVEETQGTRANEKFLPPGMSHEDTMRWVLQVRHY